MASSSRPIFSWLAKVRPITIIGDGWSATQLDLRKLPGLIIAVNDAAIYAPHWHIVVSMDRIWAENRVEQLKHRGQPVWLRRSTVKNFADFPTLVKFDCDHTSVTLNDEPGRLNGTHSGFCALNLAYQMRPREIYLVGFDMQLGPKGERHWYPPYPWKNGGGTGASRLTEWSKQFYVAAAQLRKVGCRVFVAGGASIPGFETIDRAGLENVPRET